MGGVAGGSKGSIWIDLENSPHVMLFSPLRDEFESRGFKVVFTARDFAQTLDLLDLKGYSYIPVGRQVTGNFITKVIATAQRSLTLMKLFKKEDFTGFISHGSRSGILAARMLGIPIVTMGDYEYSNNRLGNAFSTAILRPDVTDVGVLRDQHLDLRRYHPYDGIKEDIYLSSFQPDRSFRRSLGVGEEDLYAVFRPPATTAHYHDPASVDLMRAVLEHLLAQRDLTIVALPRNSSEKEMIASAVSEAPERVIFPSRAVDGANLIWHSDCVVSGGGTMNREAAVLGVPVYSIFTGRKGSVDAYLEREGLLVFIRDASEISGMKIVKRKVPEGYRPRKPDLRKQIVERIIEILQ